MRTRSRRSVNSAVVALILLIALLPARPVKSASSTDASQAINQAESSSQVAYRALRDAKLAGASTSSLDAQFNIGLSYLEEAKKANSTASYALGITLSNEAAQIFVNVTANASSLEKSAVAQQILTSSILVVTAVGSVLAVTLGYHFLETRWRRHQLRRLQSKRIKLRES